MAINYSPTTWVNGRDGGQTPINATNMNKIEQGIKNACDGLDTLGDPVAVAHGGTGASSAANARKNLGVTPDELYSNESGTTGTITLSSSAANYSHMRIYFKESSKYNSTDLINPNGKTASLISVMRYSESSDNQRIDIKQATVSGSTITQAMQGRCTLQSDGKVSPTSSGSIISIIRVEAWN